MRATVAGLFYLKQRSDLEGLARSSSSTHPPCDSRQVREYDVVRVVRLHTPDRRFDGTEGVRRAPQVGDVATICHELDPSDPSAPVVVEMVDDNSLTIWLADTIWLANFDRSELELVHRP